MSIAGLPRLSGGSRVQACVDGPIGTGIFAGLCLWGLYTQFSAMINHDTAWYLHSVAAFLDGGRLYQDVFFEMNPPLAFYLTVPPVYVARLTGIFPAHVFVAYAFGLIALSLFLSWRLSPADTDRVLRRGVLFAAMLALIVVPMRIFGQREHLMLILALPYLLLLAGRTSGARYGRPLAVFVGILAALGFGLKPHFLLVAAMLELYLLGRRRRPSAPFRPETLAMAAVLLLYVGAILLFTPDYVTRIVPYALEVYNSGYRNSLGYILWRQETFLVVLVPLLYLAVRSKVASRKLGDILCIAALGFYIVYLVQMKGWPYHVYPTSACLVLAAGVLLFGLRVPGRVQLPPQAGRRLASYAVLTAALFLVLLVGQAVWRGGFRSTYTEFVAPVVRENAEGSSIFIFTSNVWAGFPLTIYADVGWSSRFPTLWLLPGLERARRASTEPISADRRALLDEIERFLIDAVVSDLSKQPPAVVIVDVRKEKSYFGGLQFDYLAYFSRDPRFAEIWSHYELLADFGTYHLYKRRPPPH